jgi:hypothetical protein
MLKHYIALYYATYTSISKRMKILFFLVRRMKLINLFVLVLDINECKISNKCFGNCTNLPGISKTTFVPNPFQNLIFQMNFL